jgi:hypothetical protein
MSLLADTEVAWIMLALAGAIGGIVKSLMESNGRVALPAFEVVTDATGKATKYIYLGFVGAGILGFAAGGFLSVDLMSAFLAGMSSSFVLEKMIEKSPEIIKKSI